MINKEYKIYTLSDPITGEIRYVGVTSRDLDKRLYEHIRDSKKHTHYNANWIRGLLKNKAKPIIELLEYCSSDNWIETEQYWISQLKSWNFRLTNLTDGGEGLINPNKETIDKIRQSTIKRLSKPGVKEHLRNVNLGKKHTVQSKNKMSINNAKYWKGKNLDHLSIPKRKPILQYSIFGIFIKKWNSILEASKELNISNSHIVSCCKNKRKSAGNFIWKYFNNESDFNKIDNLKCINILQYNLEGKFLKEFISINEASKNSKISKQSIRQNCLNITKRAGQFIWKYKTNKKIQKKIKKYINNSCFKEKKRVLQINKNFIVNEFESLNQASKITKINISSILEVCNGKRKQAGGFIWKYKN